MEFYKARLKNGLEIVAERASGVHSVTAGFFVRTGSRDETAEVSGVSHFLEHMAFKGTERHSADDVNRIFDEIGAKYNASTSEETTLFYAAVLPEYLPTAVDLLADILRPAVRQEDFDMEKKVILEEIGMYQDQPSFKVYDNAMSTHFAGHPLGQSILGSNESVGGLKAEQMRAYHQSRYTAGNIVLAVAGKFDWEPFYEQAAKACESWPAGGAPREALPARPQRGFKLIHKPTSTQQHVMQFSPAPPASDELRFAAELLAVVIGDDTGSRMFWEMVDPGYAESADIGYSEFDGSGAFITYFSSIPEESVANLGRVRAIYDDINRNGVTEEELAQAKNKVASRIVLRSERPMGRLGSLGHNWLTRREYRSVEEDLKTVRNMNRADIRRLLDQFPLTQLTTSTIGPLESLPVDG